MGRSIVRVAIRRGLGASGKPPCFFAGIFISRWVFRQLRPEGFQRASGKPFGAPAGAYPCPRWGLTRRLRRGGRICNLHGVLIYVGGDPKGVQGGERKATLHCSKVDNLVVRKSPLRGPDAPTPAREKGLQPYGALTLFFRWRKKSVQKKASGTATPGKSPLLSIFERGSSQCRAQHG